MTAPDNSQPDAPQSPPDAMALDQALAVLRNALELAEQQTGPEGSAAAQKILQVIKGAPPSPAVKAEPPAPVAAAPVTPKPRASIRPPASKRAKFSPAPAASVTLAHAPIPFMVSPSAASGAEHSAVAEKDQAAKRPRISFWRKLGGGSLAISILVHVLLLIIGAYWVYSVIQEPEKVVDFMPAGDGGGGGERGAKYDIQRKQQKAMMPVTSLKRVFAEGAEASFSLPPPEESVGEMSPLTSLTGGGMSGGMGGAGSGGGMGGGQGKGVGNGMGPGMGGGAGLATLFGMVGSNENRLVGSIYDLHQTSEGKLNKNPQEPPNADGLVWVRPIVTSFIDNGWREEKLENYFKGPATLGVTQILIPYSLAPAAPEAFQAGDKMKGGAWVAVYRGRVTAPETAEIRFLGSADNFIVLRWNRKNILAFDCGRRPSETQDLGLRMPMAVGDWIDVKQGSTYDIAVLIGDAGGIFSACLYYEKKDAPGKRFLFRTEISDFAPVLAKDTGDMPKNFEVDGPVWPCKPTPRGF